MGLRYFALVYGIVFLMLGVAGFIPAVVRPPDEFGTPAHGTLFGLFPINPAHNFVHLVSGVWGLAASGGPAAARIYAKCVAIGYGVLAIMGLFPVLDRLYGVIPLYGHNVWLHAALALAALYFGFESRPGHTREPVGRTGRGSR